MEQDAQVIDNYFNSFQIFIFKFLGQLCGGSLISKRLVATAFHCALAGEPPKLCDYSDGKAKVILNAKNLVIYHNVRDLMNTGEQRKRVTLKKYF